ncbi:C2H2-type domain-containing protein [Plasmodiophora brassicae]
MARTLPSAGYRRKCVGAATHFRTIASTHPSVAAANDADLPQGAGPHMTGSMRVWPDDTPIREFFNSTVALQTALPQDRLDAVVASLLREGFGTFGVLRSVVEIYDQAPSPAHALQMCVQPPMPLGVCFVVAKHLVATGPPPPHPSAATHTPRSPKAAPPSPTHPMTLLVRATATSGNNSSAPPAPGLTTGDAPIAAALPAPGADAESSSSEEEDYRVKGAAGTVRHSGTHQCPYCPKRFQYCHLQDHIRSHTGEKPFVCPHCDKNFSRNSTMRRHVKRLHKLPPPPSQYVAPHRVQAPPAQS